MNDTGLDYSDSDMSVEQIQHAIRQIITLGDKTNRRVFDSIYLGGGEVTLHPQLVEITRFLKRQLIPRYINEVTVNSNLIVRAPEEIRSSVINYTSMDQKEAEHNTALLHPDDIPSVRPSYLTCTHYRKNTIVLSYNGYNVCCAADAYMRLFGNDFFVVELPDSIEGFPLNRMEEICQHCPFGCPNQPFEKNLGRPVSTIYQEQMKINRERGPRIRTIFPSH